jgi:hypothetical protein
MVLISPLIRHAAITGDADRVNAWFAGRQGGRWVEQTVRSAMPSRARANPAKTLRKLTELHERGVITDAELQRLRASLGV